MEAMQDKQIREKLESLDSLPEGYTPNLDSKWELLQAGKPEKKRMPYYWFAAAASLLLLLSFGYLFWQPAAQVGKETIASQEVSPEKAAPIAPELYQAPPLPEVATMAIAVPEKAAQNATVLPPKTKKAVKAKAPQVAKTIPEITKPELLLPEPEPAYIAMENPEAAPKKRHRFVEVDFESPETPQRISQPTQTAQLQLKVRFLPQTPDAGNKPLKPENPFRLQHTF